MTRAVDCDATCRAEDRKLLDLNWALVGTVRALRMDSPDTPRKDDDKDVAYTYK